MEKALICIAARHKKAPSFILIAYFEMKRQQQPSWSNDRWYYKLISNEAKIDGFLSLQKKLTCKNYFF